METKLQSWVMLFAVRKQPDESYCDLFRRIDAARNHIVHVTPPDFSAKQQFDEISLFAALTSLPPDDLLRRQLVSQKGHVAQGRLSRVSTYRQGRCKCVSHRVRQRRICRALSPMRRAGTPRQGLSLRRRI